MSKTKVIQSQRQPRNLKWMLTNSYFSSQKDTDPEVKSCGTKPCGTCPYLKQGKEFTFSATNETFWIKHSMNCTKMNLICVITCAGCGHNYIGEMGDVLRKWVTVHKHQIRDPHTRMLGVSILTIFWQRDRLLNSLSFRFTGFSAPPRAWERTKRGFLFWNINPFLMI